MAYRRPAEPNLPNGEALTAAMVGIGVGFAATAASEPNIEDTLLAASIEGMEHDDLRVLSALTKWLSVHHGRVNADRLIRIVSTRGEQRHTGRQSHIGCTEIAGCRDWLYLPRNSEFTSCVLVRLFN
ncbi:MAG TPA: hypothetical protein VIV60_36570 [Polyangiaceae bacterium]